MTAHIVDYLLAAFCQDYDIARQRKDLPLRHEIVRSVCNAGRRVDLGDFLRGTPDEKQHAGATLSALEQAGAISHLYSSIYVRADKLHRWKLHELVEGGSQDTLRSA